MNNHNSNKNQDIKAKLVQREVICNLNQVIQHLSENQAFGIWEDDYNELVFAIDYEQSYNCSGEHYIQELDGQYYSVEIGNELDTDISEPFDTDLEAMTDCCYMYDLESEYSEPLEFWGVSEFMARQLSEQGEIVVDMLGFHIWGRTTSGQAIMLDHCIGMIASKMEILEGQTNEWSVN